MKSVAVKDICIIGGCGHVGLPLGLVLADKRHQVTLYDINEKAVKEVNAGRMPFKENGASELLTKTIADKKLKASSNTAVVKRAEVIIVTLDTPLDEHLSPDVAKFIKIIQGIEPYLNNDQLVIFRSTLYPGATRWIHEYLKTKGKDIDIAFCPERIAEGHAIRELQDLPQIVSGCSKSASRKASEVFETIAPKIIETDLLEAELAKLMTNTWRYISFAVANQFYMIAQEHGADFNRIHQAMTEDYPRAKSFPRAGFSAGPCLVKDTMQLLNFADNHFPLGEAARQVNEGMPRFVVNQLKKKIDLKKKKVAILGMAFKPNSDDSRQSLSYRLRKILQIEAKSVICSDPHIDDNRFVNTTEAIKQSDIVVIAVPHDEYRDLTFDKKKVVVDVWNSYEKK